jgi:membrane protease YdiL (CAAX protease family)
MSLALVLPLLLTYEAGVLLLGAEAVRNGADVWLRQFLDGLGFAQHVQYFLLPAATIGILLGWHHLTHEPWTISREVLAGMVCESVVWAVLLVGLAQLQGEVSRRWGLPVPRAAVESAVPVALEDATKSLVGRIIGYCGAGIYEEVLFRLILLSACGAILRFFFGPARWTAVAAVLASSVVFSAAHYVGPHGEPFQMYSFVFRFLAGGMFAILFVLRGFGIAVGTHAAYDLIVGVFF